MTEKDIINQIQKDTSLKADIKLWENIKQNLPPYAPPIKHSGRRNLYRFACVLSCCVLIAAVILSARNVHNIFSLPGILALPDSQTADSSLPDIADTSTSTSTSPQGETQSAISQGAVATNGVCMFEFYRYNGSYYKMNGSPPEIQNNIEKCLYNNLYKIKGVDPGKSIALFINRYYWELTYVFSDTVYYNGKPYLLDMKATAENIGDTLGKTGDFNLFAIKNCDSSKEIAVQYGNTYHPAYQMLSSVSLNGINYEIEPQLSNNSASVASLKYLGKAGPYDAYKMNGTDITDTIVLKINDSQTADATAMIVPPADQVLPQSLYGSVFENFYANADIQYKGHGVYTISSSYQTDAAQQTYQQEIETLLDTEIIGKTTYEIYQIKGVDPAKTIIVKYDNVYVQYDYIFPDTIEFKGAAYSLDLTKSDDSINGIRIIKGNKIGDAGKYPVYAINQIDPSVAVIAEMYGSNKDFVSLSMTMTFYRVN